MKKVVLFASLIFLVSSAWAERIHMVVKGEKIVVDVPSGWVLGYQNSTKFSYIREYIPSNQTIPQWTKMVTVQAFVGLSHVPAKGFIDDIAPRLKGQCKSFKAEKGGDGNRVATMWSYCGEYTRTNKGEVTLFRVIKGKDVLFVVQRAWRGKVFDVNNVPLTATQRADWNKMMQSVAVD